MAYQREHALETRIVRIFNTYGPRMRLADGRVVPAFISQALASKPLTVFGDGSQTRSFCYCSDLIEGIYRLMMSSAQTPINIGNPKRNDHARVRRSCAGGDRFTEQNRVQTLAARRPTPASARHNSGTNNA